MKVKYLRVSTTKQDTTRQEMQLDKLGITFDREYIDNMTGKSKDRPQLNKMLFEVKDGKNPRKFNPSNGVYKLI